MVATKNLINNAETVTMSQALDAECVAQRLNARTGDVREAMAAFMEKREPVFRGR